MPGPSGFVRGWASLFAALWRHAAGQRGALLGAYALLLSAELLRLAVPWLAARAIDAIQQNGVTGLSHAGQILAGMFGCICLAWSLHAPGRILERNVALHAQAQCCRELLGRLLRAPPWWHRGEAGAQRAHRVMQASHGLHAFAEMQYVYLQNAVTLIGPIVALWWLSPWVGLAASIGFGLIGALSLRADHALVRLNSAHNEAERAHHATWVELLTQMLTVQTLRAWSLAGERVERALAALAAPLRRAVRLNEAKWAMVDVGSAAIWCGLVVLYTTLGKASTAAGGVALGGLYMVYEYARRAEGAMAVIAGDFGQMARQLADHAAAEPILAAPCETSLVQLQATSWHELCLVNIALPWQERTQPRQQPAIPRLILRRGRSYAVIGRSGAGKSTLLRVLSGLEVAARGSIEIDGAIATTDRLRRESTLILQDSVLFDGTLDDNLLLGNETLRAQCAAALACVCADEFLDARAERDTMTVSDGGANWSGGQRQRLALARGLLAAYGGAMVLLDEPTASLDPVTQVRVLRQLLAALRTQCVVVSVHHMELLKIFDEVIVIDEGALVDCGPVSQVRARCALMQVLESAADQVQAVPQ